MTTGHKGVKFTRQDHQGIRSVGALEVLASVIQAMIETDGCEHTAGILEGMADRIRDGEFDGAVEPGQHAVH